MLRVSWVTRTACSWVSSRARTQMFCAPWAGERYASFVPSRETCGLANAGRPNISSIGISRGSAMSASKGERDLGHLVLRRRLPKQVLDEEVPATTNDVGVVRVEEVILVGDVDEVEVL